MNEKRRVTPLSPAFNIFEKIELAIGGLTLAILFVIIMAQIISRLLNIPLTWSEEATRVFFLWMMWAGVGAGFNHCESSRVTFLVNRMPEILQKFCHILYYVFCAGMFLVLIVYGCKNAMQQLTMNEMGSAFRIPMWLVGIAVPIGAVFGLLGVIHTAICEPYLLKTTAEQLEADELAARAREKFAAEAGEGKK